MHYSTSVVALLAAVVAAQRPSDTPICDYYTTALLKNNTAANQKTLLTVLVNTAVIGSFAVPGVNATGNVAGILAPGKVNDTDVDLLPYFNGGFASTNNGGSMGVSQNFLDGGGAEPLKNLMPANDTTSNQYFLLTHLYEYFGVLLGCSMQGGSDYPAYEGEASQYEVHKFMDLNYAQVSYFITQVAASAKSFGVAEADLEVVGKALNSLFNVRCAPAATVVPAQGAQLQSICIDGSCPLAENSACALYSNNGTNATRPSIAVSSLVPNNTASSTSSNPSSTGSSGSGDKSAANQGKGVAMLAVLGGLLGLMALL